MGVGNGGEGFGFAPRGDPNRRKIGNKTATAGDGPPQPSSSRPPYPAVLSGDHVPLSRRPPWVWLLIGVLLGSGATLLMSSIWLHEIEVKRVAEALPGMDGREQVASGEASENGEPLASALGSLPTEGDWDDIAAATTVVAALAVDEADARDAIDREGEPPVDHDPDEVALGEPEGEARSDAFSPAARPASLAELDRQAAAITSSASAVASSATTVEGIREESPSPPSPSVSSEEALTGLTQDVSRAASDVGSVPGEETAEAEPLEATGPTELPPRIEQALQIANGTLEPSARLNGDGERLYRVQLAAFFSEAAARTYWNEANRRLPGVFTDVEPIFDQRTVDERLYLRIWVGAFDSRVEADGYCGWLKEQGQDCFVTRVDNL